MLLLCRVFSNTYYFHAIWHHIKFKNLDGLCKTELSESTTGVLRPFLATLRGQNLLSLKWCSFNSIPCSCSYPGSLIFPLPKHRVLKGVILRSSLLCNIFPVWIEQVSLCSSWCSLSGLLSSLPWSLFPWPTYFSGKEPIHILLSIFVSQSLLWFNSTSSGTTSRPCHWSSERWGEVGWALSRDRE